MLRAGDIKQLLKKGDLNLCKTSVLRKKLSVALLSKNCVLECLVGKMVLFYNYSLFVNFDDQNGSFKQSLNQNSIPCFR